jgi:Serine dehydrogenase proteinase
VIYDIRPIGALLLPSEKSARMDAFWNTIAKLEAKRRSKIFCLIHCPTDEHGHVCAKTLWNTMAHRDSFTNIDTLEILLYTPGGSADIAYQVMRFFRHHCRKLNIIVPLKAKSAGTLMCLGADAIYMGEFAELGPIDVQITDPLEKGAKSISPLDEFKSAEFLRDYAVEILDIFILLIVRRSGMSVKEALHEALHFTTEIMRPLYEQLDPLEIGEYKRALAIGEEYGDRLLGMTKNPHRKAISQALLSKYPSHGFVIDRIEAKGLGLPVHALEAKQESLFLSAVTSILSN